MIYKGVTGADRRKTGGKGYQLASLKQAGYRVPPFFVLTTEFFSAFLGEKEEEYRDLLSNYEPSSLPKIRALIEGREFSEQMRKEFSEALQRQFESGDLLALRSSAVDEDGETHSFAGMMETFLNVSRDEDLEGLIKACYLSCFSDRAMEYRRGHGLINEEMAMAVIVQKMVEAEVSAVMFTTDPQTNDPDKLLISAVEGLGEGLVSGEKNSHDVIVDIFGDIVTRSEGFPLSDEKIREVAALGREIEDLHEKKRARDIELCVSKGEIYLLQDRLITTYRHIDKREFRTILDNSNIIESYSGVTTPLTFSFAREVYEKIYRQTLKGFYISEEDIESVGEDLRQMICFYENKVYYRLNSWYRMTALYPGYEKNKRYMENMMGVKVELKESESRAKLRLMKIYLRFGYKLLRIRRDSEAFVKKFERLTSPYANNRFEGYADKDLLKVYRDLEEAILDDFTTPITNDMGAMVFFGLLSEKLKKKKIKDSEGLIGKILSKQGNVESVKQSLALMEIVNEIWDDEELLQEFRRSSIEELRSRLKDGREVNRRLLDYIDNYGARAMDELKLETVTLQEDSTFLFQTLKNYLKMEGKVPVYQIEEVDEGELYRQVSFLEKQLLKVLVGITKYFVRNRELLRLRRTYIYAIVRNIFLRFGHNFEARGILEHYRDVFFLTKDEVFSLAEGKDFDVRERIEQRKEEYETNKEKKIYERMYFYGEVAEETMIPIFSRQEILEHDETMLYGVAGGGGVVEGRVKYVTDPADADVDGYILMAQRTDPGWTVLFPMAKAVIIERGSVLSHSAVIAREMGLTLVVGVRGLTDRVKDGMKVRVDGIRGSIELMEEE